MALLNACSLARPGYKTFPIELQHSRLEQSSIFSFQIFSELIILSAVSAAITLEYFRSSAKEEAKLAAIEKVFHINLHDGLFKTQSWSTIFLIPSSLFDTVHKLSNAILGTSHY